MEYKTLLKKQFGSIILDAKLVEDKIFDSIFQIILDTNNLKDIEKWTKTIYSWLESQPFFKDEYSVEILSRGDNIEIEFENLSEYKDQKLEFHLKKSQEKTNLLIGQLFDLSDDLITIKWNQKGNIRKIKIEKTNIEKIQKHFNY